MSQFSTPISESSGQAAAALPSRVVTLGDSITDGHTYALLLAEALRAAALPEPVFINAGVAGDTAAMMLARLERDVLPFNPGLVTLLAGTNDAIRAVSPSDYARDVDAISQKLHHHGIPLLLMTPPQYGPQHGDKNAIVAAYAKSLYGIAARRGHRVADVQGAFARATGAGVHAYSHDDIHLSFEGYRTVTRALLDALGHPSVAVPTALHPSLLPGVPNHWLVRAAGESALSEVAGLVSDSSWVLLTLPQRLTDSYEGEENHWWPVHERQRGFAYLKPMLGASETYHARTTVQRAKPESAYLNTGARVQAVWLNGTCVHRQQGFAGWHAGRERVSVQLRAGENAILLECGDAFFLSITDCQDW